MFFFLEGVGVSSYLLAVDTAMEVAVVPSRCTVAATGSMRFWMWASCGSTRKAQQQRGGAAAGGGGERVRWGRVRSREGAARREGRPATRAALQRQA